MIPENVEWLIVAKPYNITLGAIDPKYFSGTGFVTKPSDTPANTFFVPVIENPGSFASFMFSNGRTSGESDVGFGDITLIAVTDDGLSTANTLDELGDNEIYAWDGREVEIRYIEKQQPSLAYTESVLWAKVQISSAEASWTQLILHLQTPKKLLDVEIQGTLFAGTNALPAGVEGVAGDLASIPKPIGVGKIYMADPPEVNTSKLEYQVHDGAIDSIVGVKVAGVALSAGSDYATIALLEAASTGASNYDTCLAEGIVRIGTAPAGIVTVDFIGAKVTNLTLRSEDLSTTWTLTNTTLSTDQVTSPNGSLTADKIKEDTTNGEHRVNQTVTIVAASYTISAYVKSVERSRLLLVLVNLNGTASQFSSDFNLTAKTTTSASTGGGAAITSAIADVGDDWFRVSVSGTLSSDVTSASVRMLLVNSSGSSSYAGTTGSGIYATMTQCTRGIRPLPYVASAGTAGVWSPQTAADIADFLARDRSTVDFLQQDRASFATLTAAVTYVTGIWVKAGGPLMAAIDEVLESIGAFSDFGSDRKMRVVQFIAPTGTEDFSLETWQLIDDLQGLTRVPISDEVGGVPSYRAEMTYQRYYRPLSQQEVAGSVTQANASQFAQTARAVYSQDLAVLTKHPLSQPRIFNTLLTVAADAQAEAARRLVLYKADRKYFQVQVPTEFIEGVKIGQVVKLTVPRFSMDSGKKFTVIGIIQNLAQKTIQLDLWG